MQQQATLGGGCFWCLEAVYQQVKGVTAVESGYAGGHMLNPDYKSVCSGTTGHVEVVQITFDPAIISYEILLEIFFVIHDPTTLDRQGADVGTQYRSVIFTHDAVQEKIADAVIAKLSKSGVLDDPIVTQVLPLDNYFKAESHHQNYFFNHPESGYCSFVVSPKVGKFRKQFGKFMKS
jgi:peptide-methionine (S)-S-oxide reductase